MTDTERVRTVDAETLRLAFLWRTKRTVTRQATISLQGNTYHVDPAWCGQTIELRYDPFDLSRMEVYRDAVRLGTAILIKHKEAIERVTFWGLNDRRTWRNGQNPLIFDSNNQRKACYVSIVEALLHPDPNLAAPK